MYPAGAGKTWHVSEEGHEGQSFLSADEAVAAAIARASIIELSGRSVQIPQEGADGTWALIRE
jgi:sarcosine oxidase gamma subunit